MSRKKRAWKRICNILKDRLPVELLELLPRGWAEYGRIIVIRLPSELKEYEKEIGNAYLQVSGKDAVYALHTIEGIIRKPEVTLLAGKDIEEVTFKELNAKIIFPVKKVMWSLGNHGEKERLLRIISSDDIIVDMFACIGQWSIILAVNKKPKKIFAIDINPIAIEYLKKNIKLNKVENIIFPILGDCRVVAPRNIATRVIAGTLFDSESFIKTAVDAIYKRGTIHYHFLSDKKNPSTQFIDIFNEYSTVIDVKIFKVKSYAPKVMHYVADVVIEK